MGATILESLSNRKLAGVLSILFMIQVLAFYVGGFLAPPPSSIEQITPVHCHRKDRSNVAIPRHHKSHDVDSPKNCDRISMSSHAKDSFEMTTFAIQLPLPRDGVDLAYSRWMQTLLLLLNPEIQYEPMLAHAGSSDPLFKAASNPNAPVLFDIKLSVLIDVDLAVKNRDDIDWTIYARRKGLKRTIHCHTHDLKQNHKLECDLIQLFELQSLHYDYYLINFEIREDKSANMTIQFPGKLNEVLSVAIHHNGGFMQIWLGLKTVCFIATLATLIWFCKRLFELNRKTTLIERILVGLGSTLTQFNAPVELLSLHFDLPFMTFLNDLRQGLFYCVLFSFWIIFFGEHLQDSGDKRRNLTCYSKELLAICIASLSLLILDLSERGIQAIDPFLTIWESKPNLANLSICIAFGASLAYISYLAYYIYLAYSTISGRQSVLPKMQLTKRLKYQGLIYRFKFLLSATIVCALSTFVFYGLSQHNDRVYEEDIMISAMSSIEWTSAMLVSVCAMWNLYVITLMILYAPSYKGIIAGVGLSDEMEFDSLTNNQELEEYITTHQHHFDGDMNLLQQMAAKANQD